MPKKIDKFINERNEIFTKLLGILNITNESNKFYLHELDASEEKQKQIMNLVTEIKKYFICSTWTCFCKDDVKRNYLSIIKYMMKDMGYKMISTYNSKSVNYKNFKKFIKKKNELNNILLEKYKDDIFRKYKWYGYINRKKAETDLIRNIKETFGKDVNIIQGDWSVGKTMRGIISTPNLGLKRKLAEYYPIYNLDEYRTSCINHKTETLTENIYLPDKNGKSRKIHSILTYQTESKRLECINRDENSVNNMIKLVNYYFEHKDRPEIFKRGNNNIQQKIPTPKISTRKSKVSNGIKPVIKD